MYKPEFVTLAPPLLSTEDEVINFIIQNIRNYYYYFKMVWFNPTNIKEHTVAYDVTMCVPDPAGQEARQLMSKAYKSALSIPQQHQLVAELENDSKLVYHIGLTPSKVTFFCCYIFISNLF